MRINFFDVDEFCKDLPEVTSAKVTDRKNFDPAGLFSENIFGPERTGTCSCGTYWGRSKIGFQCPKCGVTIGYASDRRKKFAKIKLPIPVVNPIMYFLILKVGKTLFGSLLRDMILPPDNSAPLLGIYYDEKAKKYVRVEKPAEGFEAPVIPEGVTLWSGPEGVKDFVLFEANRQKDTNIHWKYIYDNISKLFMHNVIVCPPEFRPVSKTKDVQMRDKMNEFYLKVINLVSTIRDDISTYENTEIHQYTFRKIQKAVLEFYQYIFSKFAKKTGLIRGSILGKRIDFSARAVIAPDPTLHLNECSIPYVMALELFKLNVANRLLELRQFNDKKFTRYDPAIDYINKCIKLKDYALYDIVCDVTKDKSIMLNRQPTLHRMGLMSYNVKVNRDYVIKIHPLICEPYNADFDGDQMAAYVSLYDETEQESRDKVSILANLISPSTGQLVTGVNQDILLGLFLLTKPDESNKITTPKGIVTYKGRVKFNEALPEDFPFVNQTINKKQLGVLLNFIAARYEPPVVMATLDNIKKMGLEETTRRGATFSLEHFGTNNIYEKVCEIVDDPKKDLRDKYFELQSNPIKDSIQKNFPYADFIESGSRGSWDQANQLIYCRGYMSDSRGNIVETPIKHNLVDGLTQEEFFISCYGSRKALLDVAINTAVSGYLTRQLVYCGVNAELDEETDDCGTQDCLKVTIPEILTKERLEELVKDIKDPAEKKLRIEVIKAQNDELDPVKLAKSFIGRWMKTPEGLKLITKDNYLDNCGKTIEVRSPIFCKNPRFCKKCYGESHKFCHSKYVGIIAAQALGEVATQLTLRTFHIGGIAQLSRSNQEAHQQDIINDLSVVSKLLHGSGGIQDYKNLIKKLFSIYSKHRILLMVHFEVIISQLMRVGSIKWRIHPKRDEMAYTIASVENVPSRESFLLALAFSKPFNCIIGGILGVAGTTDGILEKMLLNKVGR